MHDALEVTDELARGWGGVAGRVTGRGYAPACAGLEAQDSYELRVTMSVCLSSRASIPDEMAYCRREARLRSLRNKK